MARRSWLSIASLALVGASTVLALGVAAASGDSGGPPVSTARPVLTGHAAVGGTLSTTSGSWSASASFTYQWLRCNAYYADCENIPGATGVSYTVVAADLGHPLEAQVTATNDAGTATAVTNPTLAVVAGPPRPTHNPWIAGTKEAWQTVYERDDRWSGSPYMWKYEWLRCSAKGTACVPVGAVQCSNGFCIKEPGGDEYQLTGNDVGHRIRVEAIAWNAAGRGTSISNPTRVIAK